MKTIIAIIIFLFCQLNIFAQFTPFSYTYGGLGNDMGYDIVEADDSGYVCVGQTGSPGYTNGSSDIYVFKTDINGQLLWRKNYGGFNAEVARSITKAHGGGFIIAGYTNSYGSGGYDYFILKIDEQGDTLWSKTYGGSDWDFAYAVCSTADGNYLVAGETFSYGSGGADIWVLKINDSGDTLSTFLWGENGDQTCRDIFEYEPGKAVMAGYGSFPPSSDNDDPILLSWNHLSNTVIFETITNLPGDQRINACDSSTSGGIVLFGGDVVNADKSNILVIFYNSSGAFSNSPELLEIGKSKELFGGKNFRDVGYYVGGTRSDSGSTDVEALFYKLGPSGYVDFGRVITANKFNSIQSVLESKDKGLVMAGISEGFGPGPSAALIWKVDSLLAIGALPVPLLGINSEEANYPGINIYPNPFTDYITVTIPQKTALNGYKIYNPEGKIVSLKNYYSSYSSSVNIYLESLPSGIYIVELTLKDGRYFKAKLIKNQ